MLVLYASYNQGKIEEARKFFGGHNINVISLKDLGFEQEAEECHLTLKENAAEKVCICLEELHLKRESEVGNYVVVGDDTGLEIECLHGEPGTRVRRWLGFRMSDEEIISTCLSKMSSFPAPEKRKAVMKTALCVKFPNEPDMQYFEGTLEGQILTKPDENIKIEGFPMESIFWVPEWGKLLGEVALMPAAEKSKYPTHREKALLVLISEIKKRAGNK